ncbi:MAG: homoserine dehydrogenase [Candidatus Liberibacter europaeus]|uniref:Homoserine dehydrogenase n=1 Tax=Candidatus Liberibacter europaeus TaxID=744859 RepID=A0A2T4VWQ3_9HYPH|nr:homoserine dehydrogenase [Candidatus Liberibacter europaeus]PTL86215.1 MAG: homoserine dehydrogenase [Candidatus Liberibacter europaeus]
MKNVVKIGIAGLGTVGSSLINIIQSQFDHLKISCGRPIVVSAVSARNRDIDRGVDLLNIEWFDDPVMMADKANIDVFVELIGGDGYPAYDSIRAAIMRGIHVVTANKALLATYGTELALLAKNNGSTFRFEASVAGGIPVIKTLKDYLVCNKVIRVYGIMNGTSNYILSHMEKTGLDFNDCLHEAKMCGYAEGNAEFDIVGLDSVHKLSILSSIAFGINTSIDGIDCEGISDITIEDIEAASVLGYRIKLLAIAQLTGKHITRRVYPVMLKCDSILALVEGVDNAVVIETDVLGQLVMIGPGAGGNPTASAVLTDICDIAKIDEGKSVSFSLGNSVSALDDYQSSTVAQEREYFIRLKILNDLGILDKITMQIKENNISYRILTCPHEDKNSQEFSVFIITHAMLELSVRKAIKFIHENNDNVIYSRVICIENL